MPLERILECTFFIPIYGDEDLSDGEQHTAEEWEWLTTNLWLLFGGGTRAPGLYDGFYSDPDSGNRVNDQSRKYIVAVSEQQLGELRTFLAESCLMFHQKCIYLSLAGSVEFIDRPET